MSKPKFMVFKLKDLWIPIIVTVFAIILLVFFTSRLTAKQTTFAPDQAFSDGLYVTTISLDNAEFNVAVSVHKNAIKSVELRNMDDDAKLMYPLFEPSMAFINEAVTKTQSLDIDVNEFAQAKETTSFLMGAVKDALSLQDSPTDMLENTVDDYIITDSLDDPINNPDMSDEMFIDWNAEIDALLKDDIEFID